MATKLYFHDAANSQSGTFPTTKQSTRSFTNGADATGALTLRTMNPTIGTAMTSRQVGTIAVTAFRSDFMGYFCSPPLAGAQTVGGGNFAFNAAERESVTGANFWINSPTVYVWRPSTGAVVGFIKDGAESYGGAEPTAANSTQVTNIPSITSNAVSAADGDVVIVEVYSYHNQQSTNPFTCTFYYDGTTENTTENAVVSNHASYIELAETLVFQGSGGDQTLTPSLFTNSNTFYAPTVSGTYTLSPGLYTDSDTFYSPTVSTSYSITPGLYTDPDTFYSPAVSATYTLTPGLYDDGDTFYTHVVSLGGSQTLVPGLYVDSDTFYSPTVSSTYTLTPALYVDPDTFYSATISSTYVIAPTLYVNPDTFYAATVGSFGGPQTLLPSLYVDPDTFYVHTITGGLGSGVGQRTRYITVEFYDGGDVWRTNIARDILEYSAQPSKIAFSYVSPQDSIAYASSSDRIHYTRGQVMESIQRRSAFKKVFVAPPPPPPPPTDPYFSNVVALLHMDGVNGGTSIIDQTGRTWSRSGTGAYLSNEISRFGATSLKNTNYSSDFNTAAGILTGTDLFTIEAWFYLLGPAFYGGNYRANSLVTQSPGGANGGFGLEINPSGNLTMDFRAGTSGDGIIVGTTTVSYNQWYFLSASWDGTTHRGFLNGTLEYSVAKPFGWKNTGAPFRLGRMVETPSVWERAINGYIDEVRVTKGVARYTANFTPPTNPFPDQ